jgi:hypothetical protein
MKEFEYHYNIRSGWRGRLESPASIGAKFLNTLDALNRVDPMFADWELTDLRAMSSLPLAAARSRVAGLVEKNVVLDDFRKPDPDYGYHAIATTGEFNDPSGIQLKVDAGGKYKGGTLLQVGDYDVPSDPAVVTYPLFKAALLAVNAIWLANWANAYAFKLHYDKAPLIPGAPLFPYSLFHIPWLAYLSAPLAVDLGLPPEIVTERTPDGGLLMIATEERLDPTNFEHLRRARILAETLIARTDHFSS